MKNDYQNHVIIYSPWNNILSLGVVLFDSATSFLLYTYFSQTRVLITLSIWNRKGERGREGGGGGREGVGGGGGRGRERGGRGRRRRRKEGSRRMRREGKRERGWRGSRKRRREGSRRREGRKVRGRNDFHTLYILIIISNQIVIISIIYSPYLLKTF